jgi:hypothetical protein
VCLSLVPLLVGTVVRPCVCSPLVCHCLCVRCVLPPSHTFTYTSTITIMHQHASPFTVIHPPLTLVHVCSASVPSATAGGDSS